MPRSLLRETQLPPSLLKFELTEAALIGNVGAARETLDRLHGMGIQLMLDDFGTGYSSLSYLQLFPFDFVKIDRPFVNRTGADQANTGMIGAMVQMARSLNLTAIAEIVETEAAAKALQEMGCDYGQGYYFSEPIEADWPCNGCGPNIRSSLRRQHRKRSKNSLWSRTARPR